MNEPSLPPMIPRGVRWEELGEGPLRGEALRVDAPREALLYLHGGGYVAGHPRPGAALPKCAVAFSPLGDLRFINESVAKNFSRDDMLSARMLTLGAGLYPGAHSVEDPLISPALGEYAGFCPLFVSVCEAECLRDDAYAVVAPAKAQECR